MELASAGSDLERVFQVLGGTGSGCQSTGGTPASLVSPPVEQRSKIGSSRKRHHRHKGNSSTPQRRSREEFAEDVRQDVLGAEGEQRLLSCGVPYEDHEEAASRLIDSMWKEEDKWSVYCISEFQRHRSSWVAEVSRCDSNWLQLGLRTKEDGIVRLRAYTWCSLSIPVEQPQEETHGETLLSTEMSPGEGDHDSALDTNMLYGVQMESYPWQGMKETQSKGKTASWAGGDGDAPDTAQSSDLDPRVEAQLMTWAGTDEGSKALRKCGLNSRASQAKAMELTATRMQQPGDNWAEENIREYPLLTLVEAPDTLKIGAKVTGRGSLSSGDGDKVTITFKKRKSRGLSLDLDVSISLREALTADTEGQDEGLRASAESNQVPASATGYGDHASSGLTTRLRRLSLKYGKKKSPRKDLP